MKTIRLHIAYDGTDSHGWQIQPSVRTVEGELTRAAMKLLATREPIKVQGASRTDAGVHAQGQVAHVRHDSNRTLWDFVRGLNALTGDDICVTRAEEVDEGFHARHSARGKIYRYCIWNHRFVHPFLARYSWQVGRELDLEAMRRAAGHMIGEHDFAAFRASDCESETTVRELYRVEVLRAGSRVDVVVEGSAFLKNMVRVIVGTLVEVGSGRMDPDALVDILAGGQRSAAGPTAPARGLSLMKVHYPDFPWSGGEPELGGPVGDLLGG